MLNTLLSRYARHAVAGLVLTGSLGLGFAGVAAAAPNRPEHPTSPTSTTRVPRPEPTTSTTRPPRPAESEFNCKRAAGALIELRKHNQELALRYARLQKLRDEAVAAGKTEAVARIDKAIAEATARHAALVERAKAVAAKISEKCSPADQASVEGGADVDG